MDNYKLPFTGEGHRVPPIPGFTQCRITDYQIRPGSVNRGLYVSRFQIGLDKLTISTGFGTEPVNSKAYLSVLSIQWSRSTDNGPGPGLVLAGSPFGAREASGKGKLLRGDKPEDILSFSKASFLIQTIIGAWTDYGFLDGNHADLAAFAKYFESGYFPHLVTEATVGSAKSAKQAGDMYGVYNLPDYQFEIGLGIEQVEPFAGPGSETCALMEHVHRAIGGLQSSAFGLILGRIRYLESILDPEPRIYKGTEYGTFPRDVPVLKAITKPGEKGRLMHPQPIPKGTWLYYKLPSGDVVRDLMSDACTSEKIFGSSLKTGAASVLIDGKNLVYKAAGQSSFLLRSECTQRINPLTKALEDSLPVYFQVGWDGFRAIHTDVDVFTIRYSGLYVYGSKEFTLQAGTEFAKAGIGEIFWSNYVDPKGQNPLVIA